MYYCIVVEVPVLGRHSVITKRSLAGSCAQRLEKECSYFGSAASRNCNYSVCEAK